MKINEFLKIDGFKKVEELMKINQSTKVNTNQLKIKKKSINRQILQKTTD